MMKRILSLWLRFLSNKKPIMKLHLLVTLFLVCNITVVQSQDVRFSQFKNVPMLINPALTGFFDGDTRIYGVYRNQLSSIFENNPFESYAIGADHRISVYGEDVLGLGVSALIDRVGEGDGEFKQTHFGVNSSYAKLLAKNRHTGSSHVLIVGAQVSISQTAFNAQGAWFSTQFSTVTSEPDLSALSGENVGEGTRLYVDSYAGLVYQGTFNDRLKLTLGGSYHHINEPIIFFAGERDKLAPKYGGHFVLNYAFSDEFSIAPSTLFQTQNAVFNLTTGGEIRYTNGDWREIALRLGTYYYLVNSQESGVAGEGFIFSVGAELEKVLISFSYDFNIGGLKNFTNARGAYELGASYILSYSRQDLLKLSY